MEIPAHMRDDPVLAGWIRAESCMMACLRFDSKAEQAEVVELLERYDMRTATLVARALVDMARTRAAKKMQATVAIGVLKWMQQQPVMLVEEGCRIYVDRGDWEWGRGEAYLKGIIRGCKKEARMMRELRDPRNEPRPVPKSSKQGSLW